ncbi:MAG: glutamate-5-semialdehyde dehydrogenase [Phycisphaerae bacterium]|nr:glutamate-5-semialdehyde dehydrogenase [Phycisphaerae bacterium]
MDAKAYIAELTRQARVAAGVLATSNGARRDEAIRACAAALRANKAALQAANQKDVDRAPQFGLTAAMIDRLRLTDKTIAAMADALEQIASQTDPVGQALAAYNRPDGLRIEKRRVPIGVIGFIYESRPNVTTDAAGLFLKSGNACILRGGKEALYSNLAVAACVRQAVADAGLPAAAVAMIDNPDREIVAAMAQAEGGIDLIIPRGGEALIRAVTDVATVPVIKHYTGNCHVYVHADADEAVARAIVRNAKCQRPGVCNAAETLLVHAAHIQSGLLKQLLDDLASAGVSLRGDERTRAMHADVTLADESDWASEYLDLILAVRVVDDLEQAVEHINRYGSHHTDAIVTRGLADAERFTAAVDSASVMVNASTRLADGGVYGLGAEVGISTDKLHARGPMGAEDLTTYKWIVTGQGHLRE